LLIFFEPAPVSMRIKTTHIAASSKALVPGLLLLVIFIFIISMKKPVHNDQSMVKGYTYLALGDSYTIGEQVASKENFPSQVTTLLTEKGIVFGEPEIIARTGWTTGELKTAINQSKLRERYDLVTLLIGVNNLNRCLSRRFILQVMMPAVLLFFLFRTGE